MIFARFSIVLPSDRRYSLVSNLRMPSLWYELRAFILSESTVSRGYFQLYWPLLLAVSLKLSSASKLNSAQREYRLAESISHNHHRFISKWCRDMGWLERDKRYSAHSAQMKATQEALELMTKYCESSIKHLYAKGDEAGVRLYFIGEFGKYSKTSPAYFLVKDYFENEYR